MSDVPRARLVIRGLRRWWGAIPMVIVIAILALRACVTTSPLDNLAPAPSTPGDPPGTTAWIGSVANLRGGPLLIGYQSPSAARLELDGAPVHDCHPITGGQLCRMIEMQGAHAIRFAAPAGARLVWSPVGRRGDPEYLPASSLSPDPPAHAEFACPGTSKLDGIFALAILCTIIATVLAIARRRLARVSRTMWLAMAGVFVVAVIVRLVDLGGAGQTWDEDVNWAAGRNYITNLLALDFRAESWTWNFEHPPIMKYLAGIGAQLADGFGPARVLSAIWVSLGCMLLVPIGARLYSLRAGVLAGAIALLLPPLVAHGQIVGHEAPTVMWWSLGVLLSLAVGDDEPDRRTRVMRMIGVGVVVGIATASRFVNGLLGPACVLIILARTPQPGYLQWFRRLAIDALIIAGVALATFYLVWPRLWAHPIDALVESYHKLDNVHSVEPFLGTVTNKPQIDYFIIYLIATMPVGVLAALLVWIAGVVRKPDRSALVIALWFGVALVVSLSPVKQDGVRYVLPCLLAYSVAAAAGIDQLARWIGKPRAFAALATAIVVYLGVVDVRTDPYYLDYFGEQVGGAGTVASRSWFETAWWGEGVDRAVDYVNEHAAPGAHVYRRCIEPAHLAWFREDLWPTMTETTSAADWIVAYSTVHCAMPKTFHAVYTVDFDGTTLATVYQR